MITFFACCAAGLVLAALEAYALRTSRVDPETDEHATELFL